MRLPPRSPGIRLVAPATVALCLTATGVTGQSPAAGPYPRAAGTAFRVLSWNVSRTGFIDHPDAFRGLVRLADPDVVVLDEVDGALAAGDVRAALAGMRGPGDTTWFVTLGRGGGYQRVAVATRGPLAPISQLDSLPYPPQVRDALLALTSDSTQDWLRGNLADGAGVHGARVRAGGRAALITGVDLQCCGTPEEWRDLRRIEEARLIRTTLTDAVARAQVDGLLIVGDLNLVGTALPLVILSGPYPAVGGLLAAEAYHRDGVRSWTWDGRGTPFDSKPIDFQLYSASRLTALAGWVVDSEDLTPAELAAAGLTGQASGLISDHRPVVVDYRWR